MEAFDVAVIGSGPGGYVAAIRAAQLGLKVCCIEKDETLGGTCLNVGCIPSKALLEATGAYYFMKQHGAHMGIVSPDLSMNFDGMMQHKSSIVKTFTDGVKGLFKKNKIHSIIGKATLKAETSIEVNGQSIEAKNIILATGSAPQELSFLPVDEKKILFSTGMLKLSQIPKKLLVIGAGVIGVELGSVYARLGTEVTFVEMLETICGNLDLNIHNSFLSLLKKQGLIFHLGAEVKGAKIKEKITVSVQTKDALMDFEPDAILVAIGRKPYTDGLGLENLKITTLPKGQVSVDNAFRTSIPSIYAIGDLIEGPMLAHRAFEEGTVVAEIIAGHSSSVDYISIPSIIYTHPEQASVGFTEQEAKSKGLDIFTGMCPFSANGRARCMDDYEGFVKVIGDKASGKLIGVHILGPHASELIGEGVVAIKNRMTVESLSRTCHAHPTLSEAIKEAALSSLGRPINL